MREASIHITRWGSSGPKVLLIHGSAQGSRIGGDHHFSAQEHLASRGWQVIVPDRPGHGRSPAPGRPDDAEADGAWAADLLEEGAHLVGHSFGGCVALAAAARRPSAVRSLTLIEPGMMPLAMGDWRVLRWGMQAMTNLVFATSAASRAVRFAKMMRIPPELRGGSDPTELERMGQALTRIRIPSRQTLHRQLEEVRRAGIPLLVVTGGWSPALEATADVVAKVGGGQRLVIRSEHHFPHLVSPQFNDALVDFMTRGDPGP